MTGNHTLNYTIKVKSDVSGINQLKTALSSLSGMQIKDLIKIDPSKTQQDLEKIKTAAKNVEDALTKSFNKELGTLNVAKFNKEIKNSHGSLSTLHKDFALAGSAGQNAFRNIATQVMTTNLQLKDSYTFLDKMAETMGNTIKWNIASSAMNMFTGRVQEAYGYVKHLDSSLNDIRIVTGQSAEEMAKFAQQANKAAQALGKTTTDYTEASLIYYQQGLSDAEVKAKTETTLKAANVTGQSAQAVSEQLTAVWNGYKVDAAEAELYVDKLQAVAATTASDLQELSTGMSKVASAANLMGVDMDSLNAQLATIISVTRQAPESVGTALKTIYARMGDIEAGLDTETTLGEYTEKMSEMGVNVLDANGKLRDMGDVIEEIGGKWANMSREQQLSLSQTMAGTRQYNNLLALFDNWDMYTDALSTSQNATGALQDAQDIYMESTEAHLNALKSSWEDLYDSLLDSKAINEVSDGMKNIVELLTNFVDSIGGGIGVLSLLGIVGTKVFSRQLSQGILTFINNIIVAKENMKELNAQQEIVKDLGQINDNTRLKELMEMKRQQLDLSKSLTAEEQNLTNEMIRQKNELFQEQDALKENLRLAAETVANQARDDVEGAERAPRVDWGEKGFDVENTEHRAQLLEALKNEENMYAKLTGEMKAYQTNSKEISRELELFNQTLGLNDEQAQKHLNNLQEMGSKATENVKSISNFSQSLDQSTTEAQELSLAIQEFNEIGTFDPSKTKHIERYNKVLDAATKAHQKLSEKNKQNLNYVRNFDQAIQNNANNVNNLTQRFKNFIKQVDLKNKIQGVLNFTSALGSAAMAIQNIQRLGDIWNDDSLSVGEKTTQIMMNLSMTAGTVVSAVKGIGGAFLGAVSSIQSMINALSTEIALSQLAEASCTAQTRAEYLKQVAEQQGVAITEETTAVEAARALATQLGAEAVENMSEKEALHAAAAKLGLEVTEDMTESQILKAIAEKTGATITGQATIKDLAHAAVLKLKAILAKEVTISFLSMNLTLGATLAILAALVAVFALVAIGVSKVAEAQQAENIAAQAARERADELKKSYEELAAAANAFRKEVESYQKGVDALKELEKGTDEYKQKLQEVNEEALKLIDTYDLYGKYTYENGVIKIDEGALKKEQLKRDKEANRAENDYFAAEQYANYRKTRVDAQKISKESQDEKGVALGWSKEEVMLFGKIFQQDKEKREKTEKEPLARGDNAEYLKILKESGKVPQMRLDWFEKNLNEIDFGPIYDFVDSLDEATAASRAYAQEILKNIASEKYGETITELATDDTGEYNEEEAANLDLVAGAITANIENENGLIADQLANEQNVVKDHINGMGNTWDDGNAYEKYVKSVAGEGADMDAIVKKAFGEDASYSGNISVQEMAKHLYGPDAVVKDKAFGKNTIEYYDEEQQETVSITLSNETIAKDWAEKTTNASLEMKYDEASEEVISEEQMNNLLTDLSKIDSQAQIADLGGDPSQWQTAFSEGIANGNNFDFSAIFSEIDPEEYAKLTKEMTPEELMDFFGFDIESLKAMSFNSAAEFQEAFNKGMSKWSEEDYLANVTKKQLEKAENLGVDEKTFKAQKNLLKLRYKENEALAKNEELLGEIALDNTRIAKGVENIANGWEDTQKAFEGNDFMAQAEATANMLGNLQEMMGWSDEEMALLPEDFVEQNLDKFEAVANGAEGSIEDIIRTANAEVSIAVGMTTDEVYTELESVEGFITDFMADNNIEIGTSIDDANFINALNQMVEESGIARDDILNHLKDIGYNVQVDMVERDVQIPVFNGSAADFGPGSDSPYMREETTTLRIPTIKSITPLGTTSGHTPPKKDTGGGGGGGSKGSKKDKFKGHDRYAEVNNKLKDINNELEKQVELNDELTGPEKLTALEQQLKLIEKQTSAQGEKLKLLREEREELKKTLQEKKFEFDSKGNITNYDSLLQGKEDEVNAAIKEYNRLVANNVTGDALTAAEEAVEKATKEFEDLQTDADRYNEIILDEITGVMQEIQSSLDQKVELEVEKLKVRFEMGLSINYDDTYEKISNDLKGINNELEKSSNQLERLTTLRKKNNNLNKQETQLQNKRDTLREKDKVLKKERSNIKSFLSKEGLEVGSDGSYDRALEQLANVIEDDEKKMLEAQETFANAITSGTDAEVEAAKRAYEAAYSTWQTKKQSYDYYAEQVARIDEITLDELPDVQSEIEDALDEQASLEALRVQINLELPEKFTTQLADIETRISKISREFERTEKAIEKLTGQDKINALKTQVNLVNQQKDEENAKLASLKEQKTQIEDNINNQKFKVNDKEIALLQDFGEDGFYTEEDWRLSKEAALEKANAEVALNKGRKDTVEEKNKIIKAQQKTYDKQKEIVDPLQAEVDEKQAEIDKLEKDKEKAKTQEEKDEIQKKINKANKELKKFKKDNDFDKKVNDLKEAKENLDKTISERDSIQKEIDNAEVALRSVNEVYDTLKETLDEYNTLVNEEIPNAEDQIAELTDKDIELKLAQQELTLQIRLDFKNARKELNEFKKEILDDDNLSELSEANQTILDEYFGITPKKGEDQTGKRGYIELQKEKYKNALKAYNTIVGGGTDDTYGDNAAKALEDLTAAKDELKNLYSEVNALVEENHQNYLKGIDEADKAFTEHLEKYNDLTSSIQYQLDLVNLMKNAMKNENRILANQKEAYEKIHEINKSRRADIEKEIEYWESQKAGVAEGSEEWDKITTNLENAQKELENVTKSSIENVNKIYETSKKLASLRVDNILFGKDLDSNFDFNEEKQNWEKLSNWRKKYLDSVNEVFKKDEFIQKVNDAIENTDSLAIQERLNQLKEEEIQLLEKKGKVTQKDLDRMNKMLDIELKKIALEEAQKNKSTMRLRRDASGNYSYQYVADQDAIDKAEQELKKAQNEAYNTAKNNYGDSKTNLEKLINDFQKELEGAENKEDFNQIKSNYQEFFTDAISDYETDLANYREELKNQGKSNDEINQLIAEAFPQFGVLREFIDNFQSTEKYKTKNEEGKTITLTGFDALFEQVSRPYLDALEERIKGYEEATGEANVNGELNALTKLSSVVEKTTVDLADSMDSLITTQTTTLKDLKDIFKNSDKNLKELGDSVIKALEWYATLMQKQDNDNQSINVGDMEGFDTGGYTGGWNSSEGRLAILHQKELVLNQEDTLNLLAAMEELKEIETLGKIKNNIMDSNLLIKYKDIMDNVQKELETATKTEDFNLISQKLTMTLNFEDFSDKLETLVQDRASLLSMTSSEFEKAFKNVITDTKTQNFKQNVQINAEFPGVNNSLEIERAFNSLTSKAQRYIIDETAI